MAVLPIYNCFHEVLQKPTYKVNDFDGSLKKLIDNMTETLGKISNGLALAANQVGESKSITVINMKRAGFEHDRENIVLINPVIESYSDDEEEDQEGCLSIPTYYEKVPRSTDIQIRYNDLDMKEHVIEVSDFFARIIQHEIDHLEGKLILDRISPLRRTLAKSRLKKIERGSVLGEYSMILPNGELVKPED